LEKQVNEEISGYMEAGKTRHFVILRNGFLGFYNSTSLETLSKVITLNRETSMQKRDNQIVIKKDTTEIILTPTETKIENWVNEIRNELSMRNRYKSFAPVHNNCNVSWYINGSKYYEALLNMLKTAQKRIYIASWYLSPGLFLLRGKNLDKQLRLDNLLISIARTGVQIYIMVWKNSPIFNLQAQYVETYFIKQSKNFHVRIHPPNNLIHLWSHHQKFVVVDEEIATVGGIDLAYGRYDNDKFSLTDADCSVYPGRDYVNPNWSDGETNGPTMLKVCDRSIMHRMPWHDVHMAVDGESAKDIARNFIERWNFASGDQGSLLFPLPRSSNPKKLLNLTKHFPVYRDCTCQIIRSISNWSVGINQTEQSIANAYVSIISHANHYILIANQYFISSIDQHFPENRISAAIYERVKRAINKNETFRVIVFIPAWSAGDITTPSTQCIVYLTKKTFTLDKNSLFTKLSAGTFLLNIEIIN